MFSAASTSSSPSVSSGIGSSCYAAVRQTVRHYVEEVQDICLLIAEIIPLWQVIRFLQNKVMALRSVLGKGEQGFKANHGYHSAICKQESAILPSCSTESMLESDCYLGPSARKTVLGFANLRTLLEDIPSDGLWWRARVMPGVEVRPTLCILVENQHSGLTATRDGVDMSTSALFPVTSTPLDFPRQKRIDLQSAAAFQRIATLEEELCALRQKVATIVAMQEACVKTKSGTIEALPIAVPPLSCPPPPPPPPPPSTPALISLQQQIQKNKSTVGQTRRRPALHPGQYSQTPLNNLALAVKDLKQVQLKHVERSPGGNPLRKPPREDAIVSDEASFVIAAIKRRFASMQGHESLENDSDTSNDSFSSDTSTYTVKNASLCQAPYPYRSASTVH